MPGRNTHRSDFPALALTALVLTLGVLAAPEVRAERCELSFRGDLAVEPERVVVQDRRLGEVVIGEGGTLAIADRKIPLEPAQRAAVVAWSGQLREVVPEAVNLALDGVEIAVLAVSEVFAALGGGERSPSLPASLEALRTETRARLGRDGDVWYVRDGGIEGADDMGAALEDLVEDAVADSLGAFLIALGRSLSSENGAPAARMETFAARMARFGEDVEARVEAQAEGLERRAEVLCAELRVLELRERDMKSRIPELAPLALLDGD